MKYFFVNVVLVAVSSCKPALVDSSAPADIEIAQWFSTSDRIGFTINNNSENDFYIESSWKLFIQKMNKEGKWVKVPFIPCQCGTPCREPEPRLIAPGSSIPIEWNLISRKCVSNEDLRLETVEERTQKGAHRMIFTLNPIRDGKRLNPEKLEVYFKVR